MSSAIIEALTEGDDPCVLSEVAYVATARKFDLPTDSLTRRAKNVHVDLYEKYVEDFNRVSAELDAVRRDDFDKYQHLKCRETYLMNAVHLHELYFENISAPNSNINMNSLTYMRLARDFGTFDEWQYDFIAAAHGTGSGWAVCGYNTWLNRYVNFFIKAHSDAIPVGTVPLIVLDVWEHAYRDYDSDRSSYIYAMMKEFNWDVIQRRIEKVEKMSEVLR